MPIYPQLHDRNAMHNIERTWRKVLLRLRQPSWAWGLGGCGAASAWFWLESCLALGAEPTMIGKSCNVLSTVLLFSARISTPHGWSSTWEMCAYTTRAQWTTRRYPRARKPRVPAQPQSLCKPSCRDCSLCLPSARTLVALLSSQRPRRDCQGRNPSHSQSRQQNGSYLRRKKEL